jgi:tRNA pseudouridine13 synthase
VLSGNRFEITIRDWQGDKEKLIAQLTAIKTNGIANYYGEQRFGHNGQNVANALAMFRGKRVKREQRSIYLSATRSFLFNQILSSRVSAGTWNQALPGDTFIFDGSHSCFQSQQPDADILLRIKAKTIHPSGVLCGKGRLDVDLDALRIEQDVIAANAELAEGLIASGVELSRRALRVNVNNLDWTFINPAQLRLTFTLPAGSYATALLREIISGDGNL